MSAPEEVHIKPNRDYTSIWGRPVVTDPFDDDPATAGYIRADLHDAAIAAARAEGVREGMLKAADEDLIWEALTDANDVDVSFLDFARAVARAIRAAAEAQP